MNNAQRSIHSGRLERWLGTDRIEALSASMRGWYGPPITLLDVPGAVRVNGDGDFSGIFKRGYFGSAMDSVWEAYKRAARSRQLNSGFASVSDALSRASSGFSRSPGGMINKVGPTGVVAVASTLWRVGPHPIGGAAPGAAPGGTATTSATTGAMAFDNPSSGTTHLTGADMSASVAGNALLLYDRLFHVLKTMNSTATESVTGVPTRYQSATAANEDYAGGNFLFVEVGGTALAGTAHNWTTCLYTDQDGNTGVTLPSLTGVASAIVDRLDHPNNQWFAPLASGDTGIKALTQMQCSAAVATGVINFVIGHPLGVMTMPLIHLMMPFDWLTNRNQAPRIFDDACLALMELPKPAATATTYTGRIYTTGAAA